MKPTDTPIIVLEMTAIPPRVCIYAAIPQQAQRVKSWLMENAPKDWREEEEGKVVEVGILRE